MYASSIPCFAMMSVSRGIVLSQMPSRNPRTQHTVVCCIRGLRRTTCESWHRDELVCGYRRSSRKPRTMYMMANNETIMNARQAQVSEPEKPVEVEAADSASDMASSPVTAEDTTVTSVVD